VEIRKIPYVIHVEEGLENADKLYSSPIFQWFFTPTLKVETTEKKQKVKNAVTISNTSLNFPKVLFIKI